MFALCFVLVYVSLSEHRALGQLMTTAVLTLDAIQQANRSIRPHRHSLKLQYQKKHEKPPSIHPTQKATNDER